MRCSPQGCGGVVMVMAHVMPARRRLPDFCHLATLLGALIVGAALLVAIFAPYLVPHDPFAQDLNLRLVPPVWVQGRLARPLLGTDQIGRGCFCRLIWG